MTSKLAQDVQSHSKIANKVTKRNFFFLKEKLQRELSTIQSEPNNITNLFNHQVIILRFQFYQRQVLQHLHMIT